jgi:carbonic anhydrase/acetyltransferase-like protein (isoleucine patch superfamily)
MRSYIIPFQETFPKIDPAAVILPGAVVIGDVEIGSSSSVWFHTVVRGDINYIRIGEHTNIQDNCTLHVTGSTAPLIIGSGVTVGHGSILHGCIVGDGCLIGMGAILLDHCKLGEESMVAAGSLLPPHFELPPRWLALGSPAKAVRALTEQELVQNRISAIKYAEIARTYLGGVA